MASLNVMIALVDYWLPIWARLGSKMSTLCKGCPARHHIILSYEFRSTKHSPGMNTTRTIYWLKSLWQFINSQNVSLFACKATWYGNDFHRGRWIPPWTWCSCQRWWWSPLAWYGHRKLKNPNRLNWLEMVAAWIEKSQSSKKLVAVN